MTLDISKWGRYSRFFVQIIRHLGIGVYMNRFFSEIQSKNGHLILITLAVVVLIFQLQNSIVSDESREEQEESATVDLSIDEIVKDEQIDVDKSILTDTTALPILLDYSLSPNLNPLTFKPSSPAHEFQIYRVERGDTPVGIAELFGIKPETLLGGNPFLSEVSNALQTGTELIILPIDGLIHDVVPGDTLEVIAQRYGMPVEDIVAYGPNNLTFPYRLLPNTQIVVPGAVRELFVWNPPTIAEVNSSFEGRGVQPIIVGTGAFVWPITGRNFTQFFWYGHPGIDVAQAEGAPVVASDTGTVTFAGWNVYGYGNLIVVNHGNGYETFYAHLSGINVAPGQIVYQGNVIGAVGNTGNSSGPHLHFEVRLNANRDDPCWYIGC